MSIEASVRKVIPYVPGEQPKMDGLIKLNTNENPYPPAPGVEAKLTEMQANIDKLRLYPSPTCDSLIDALAKRYKLDKDKIFVGVGSDDVLSVAFLTFFNSNKDVLFPDITYSFYDVWCDVYRIPYKAIPLNDEYKINKADYMVENGGVVIANPNAPTGVELPLSDIEAIVAANPDSVVIVDEAYVDFGAASAIGLIDKYDNVLVVQTFSKSRSMAGLRIGMAFGNPKLIKYMNDVKFSINSYTMNYAALAVGPAALEDEEYFRQTVDKIIATRERVKKELSELGFNYLDSKTNFIFASHPKYNAADIMKYLRDNKIIVRYFNKDRINARIAKLK